MAALAAAIAGREESSQLFAGRGELLGAVPNGALLEAASWGENTAQRYACVMTPAEPPVFAPAPEISLSGLPQVNAAEPPVFGQAPECDFADIAQLL